MFSAVSSMIYLRKNHWENEKREVEELDRRVKPRIKQPVRKSSVLPNSIAQQNELRYLKKKYAGTTFLDACRIYFLQNMHFQDYVFGVAGRQQTFRLSGSISTLIYAGHSFEAANRKKQTNRKRVHSGTASFVDVGKAYSFAFLRMALGAMANVR